ncbi:MAG: cysteine synthase A [Desulfovibrionaceae bacterium]|nr:cysteine synthase A [Desulfovibrionaceae bacterium]
MIYTSAAESIGNTPLVHLGNLAPGKTVLAKVESRNPGFSVKDRVGLFMIRDAKERGLMNEKTTVVEPTSGNTGIALAFICARLGNPCVLTMPETMSLERRRVLMMLGAKILLTPGALGMAGAIQKAEELVAANPDTYFMPQQFKNPANPLAHEKTTGPEIWEACQGKIDVLVAGVGSGGTITGIARYIKRVQKAPLITVAVEPEGSPVIREHLAGQTLTPGPHGIQGIGAGFIPETLDLSLIDRVESVSDDEALSFARSLAKKEGLLAGISSGAAAAVAVRLAQEEEMQGKVIVCILPDAGERYMSSRLYTELA